MLTVSIPKPVNEADVVNHPNHYTSGKFEVIDILIDQMSPEEFKGFCKGNVLKYLMRAGKKDTSKTMEDYKKAQWYLNKMISQEEENLKKGE